MHHRKLWTVLSVLVMAAAAACGTPHGWGAWDWEGAALEAARAAAEQAQFRRLLVLATTATAQRGRNASVLGGGGGSPASSARRGTLRFAQGSIVAPGKQQLAAAAA